VTPPSSEDIAAAERIIGPRYERVSQQFDNLNGVWIDLHVEPIRVIHLGETHYVFADTDGVVYSVPYRDENDQFAQRGVLRERAAKRTT
jgi:hypothetical protein